MPNIEFVDMFNRLGHGGNIAYKIDGDQVAVLPTIDALSALYEDTADEDLVAGLLASKTAMIQSMTGPMSVVGNLAQTTMTRMVGVSTPASGKSVPSALVELIRQMEVNSVTVTASTITVSGAALSGNTGNGVLVLTTKRGDGLVQENTVAEVLRVACSSDSYTGGQTQGQEQFRLGAGALKSGTWDYDWPNASGAQTSTTSVPASEDANTNGNLLTNGDFEDWTADATPELENWTLGTGAWGTDIQRSTDEYTGTYAVEFIAGTATNTALYQQFGDGTDGTSATPSDLTSYAINFFAKRAGVVSAGVLTIEMVDDTGTVLNDKQGVANSTTITLSGLTTSYASQSVVFRTPEVPPSVIRFRFRMSTALAGANVLIDDVSFAPIQNAYPGGFGYVLFSGSIPWVTGDGFDVTATNNRGGRLYCATFQSLFDRFYNMKSLNLLLPSSATPSIPDSMITFPGIVGYYRFQNALTDSSGNANTLSDSSATYGAGIIGQGLTGGAGTRSSAFSGLTGLAIGQPVSISHWVKVPALSTGAKTGTRVGWTTDTWYMQTSATNSAVGYGVSVPGRAAVDGELPVSAWAHIVWTWDGVDAFQLYLNGVLLDDGTYTPTTANYNGAFTASADVASMGTDLDELLIANRILTAAEVYQLYANGDAYDPTNT